MPAGLRWLSIGCLVATGLTLAVLMFGPQQGLEMLAGGLLAYFVLILHIPAGMLFLILGRRYARRSVGYWVMALYFLTLWAIGAYQYVVINDIDDAAKAFVESRTDADSFQLREQGRALYRAVRLEQPPGPDALAQWRDLALTATEVNRRDEHRLPALWYAAGIGDIEMIERLLSRGARTNDPALYPSPPLSQAVRYEHAEAVRVLMDGGADPDQGVNAERPPLSVAANNQNLAITTLLLERGAQVDLGAPPAFDIAVRNGSANIVAALLDADARPELYYHSEPPLQFALENEDSAMIALLLERTPGFDTQSDRRDPMLFAPLRRCDLAMFDRYLSLGASPNIENRKQVPILTHLVQLNPNGCEDLDRFAAALLERGARARSQDLLLALRGKQTDIARTLLAHDVATEGELNKKNFLMLAAQVGAADLVQAALDQGFDVNAWSIGMNNSNALYEASRAGHAEIVELLFRRGAQLPTESIKLRNLFRFAAPHHDVLALLLAHYQQTGVKEQQRSRDIARSVIASKDEDAIAMLVPYELTP